MAVYVFDRHPRGEFGSLARARRLPRPMVFTNGVFDLLHAGHVQLLHQARRLGASLVVAVNSDASARGLGKGPGRPLSNEQDRIAVVAALRPVSLVLRFDEPTPAAVIAAIRPDIVVKGGDYVLDRLPEARQVRAWGARVVVLPLLEGRSTSALVARMQQARRQEDSMDETRGHDGRAHEVGTQEPRTTQARTAGARTPEARTPEAPP